MLETRLVGLEATLSGPAEVAAPARADQPGTEAGPGDEPAGAPIWRAAIRFGEDAVVGVGCDGRITTWTEPARRLFGYRAGEITGRPAAELFAEGPAETFPSRLRRCLTGQVLERIPATVLRGDGRLVPVSLTLAPLPGSTGACVVLRDLTEQLATQEALAEGQRRQLEALQLSKVGFWSWDVATDTLQMSNEMYRILAVDPLGFDGTMSALVASTHPGDRRKLKGRLRQALVDQAPFEVEYRVRTPDGRTAWVYERATPHISPDGTVSGLSGVCQEVTERHQSAEALRGHTVLLAFLERVAAAANEASELPEVLRRCAADLCSLFDWHIGHAVLLGRPGGTDLHLWTSCGRSGFPALRKRLEDGDSPFPSLVERAITSGRPVWSNDLGRAAAPGEPRVRTGFAFPVTVEGQPVAALEFYSSRCRPVHEALMGAAPQAAIQIGRVVERERSRHALAHQAMHDALTGLPNRSLFLDRLSQTVRGLGVAGRPVAVMFIDLDNFKLINDSLGHDIGDHVLVAVARRLTGCLAPGDTAARFGGDEFIILCEQLANDEAVAEIATRLLEAISEPIESTAGPGELAGTVVTASVGIVLCSSPRVRAEELVRDADAAMYRAKEDGKGRFHVFDPALHERASQKLSIANELRRAVDNEELRLVYQPQYRLSDGALIGIEALVRWDNPARGTLGPADWIPVAEETQLIVPIGAWIIGEACRTASRWVGASAGSAESFKVCVNVSAVQLARPELIDSVAEALGQSGMPAPSLCMEITESVLMSAPGVYLEALLGLKLMGVSIAIDDFGTGYSSLGYLRRFPIDLIKIDKAFVDDLLSGDERGRAILRAIVQLSEALGVRSVAEGVETAEQARHLAAAGCYGAQGYFYARPLEPSAVTALIASHSPAPTGAGKRTGEAL